MEYRMGEDSVDVFKVMGEEERSLCSLSKVSGKCSVSGVITLHNS